MKSEKQRGTRSGKPASRRGSAEQKTPDRRRATDLHPAGRGGSRQQAGGPQHHGADAEEDRNP